MKHEILLLMVYIVGTLFPSSPFFELPLTRPLETPDNSIRTPTN